MVVTSPALLGPARRAPLPRGAAEFPNDNPLLHAGSRWLTTRFDRPWRALRRSSDLVAVGQPEPPPLRPVQVPDWLGAKPPAARGRAAERAAAPEPSAAFQAYLSAVERVARGAGGEVIAERFRALLTRDALGPRALEPSQYQALVAEGIVAAERTPLALTEDFRAQLAAWRAALGAEPGSLQTCAETLDTWTGRVLAALLGYAADRQGKLRRELRKQGVAAFGMLSAP